MKSYWIFLIPAIVCALCSDKLDRAYHWEGRLRKVLLVFSAALFLICLIPALAAALD